MGRDYLLTSVKIKGTGPYDFMVDSGLTAELITPHLQQALGISGSGQQIAGLVGDACCLLRSFTSIALAFSGLVSVFQFHR